MLEEDGRPVLLVGCSPYPLDLEELARYLPQATSASPIGLEQATSSRLLPVAVSGSGFGFGFGYGFCLSAVHCMDLQDTQDLATSTNDLLATTSTAFRCLRRHRKPPYRPTSATIPSI